MEDEDETIYVRVRRDKTTSFFICQSYESVDSIKRRLCQYHRNVDPADIRLYYVNKVCVQ